jgi:penicillin amidase
MGARGSWWKRLGAALLLFVGVTLVLVALWYLGIWRAMGASQPRLDGAATLQGLSAAVRIERDADGVPTVTGSSRTDLARALGYLHAQERFFQMESLRRAAAGELAGFLGPPALVIDRQVRPHRFRARAEAIVASLSPVERVLLDAYVEGVNAGLADLGGRPFEHRALFKTPEPWTGADTVLVVFAMYLNLQPALP